MGHGILSGSPFHVVYIHTPKPKKKVEKLTAADTPSSKLPDNLEEVIIKFSADNYSKPSNGFRRDSKHTISAPVHTWVFSKAFGTGMIIDEIGNSLVLCFGENIEKLDRRIWAILYSTGAVYYLIPLVEYKYCSYKKIADILQDIDVKYQHVLQKKKRKDIKLRIFNSVNFVDFSSISADSICIGQEVMNRNFKIGRVADLTSTQVSIYWPHLQLTKHYPFPKSFESGRFKIWGGLIGASYSVIEEQEIKQRQSQILDMIQTFHSSND